MDEEIKEALQEEIDRRNKIIEDERRAAYELELFIEKNRRVKQRIES